MTDIPISTLEYTHVEVKRVAIFFKKIRRECARIVCRRLFTNQHNWDDKVILR